MSSIKIDQSKHKKSSDELYCQFLMFSSIESFFVSLDEYIRARDLSTKNPCTGDEQYTSFTLEEMFEYSDKREKANYHRTFRMNFMLNAANNIFRMRDLCIEKGLYDPSVFDEIAPFRNDVLILRNKNEHVDDLMMGRRLKNATFEFEGGVSDATSTINKKIGGRLDPSQLLAPLRIVHDRLQKMRTDWDSPAARQQKIKERDEYLEKERLRQVKDLSIMIWLATRENGISDKDLQEVVDSLHLQFYEVKDFIDQINISEKQNEY